MLARSAPLTADIGPLIGIAAAVLAAILAAHASWYITDRIMSWRQRADQDEF
jgi:predicted lysophospholipase L1 biosynthesis ABC-type transport system permease subunit